MEAPVMAIGHHHPENEGSAVFVVLLVCVMLVVVVATIVSVRDSNGRGAAMARSNILYPVE